MTVLALAAPRRRLRVSATPVKRRAVARRSVPQARRARGATWELRSFVGAAGAIGIAFVLALVYLAGSTGLASGGYEAQRLAAERDELRRQNALLELELARLDSPARIEAEAARLGLVRLPHVPVIPAVPLTALR